VKYVAGFLFSGDLSLVALIRKNKPAWQAGRLNGIGGKIEGLETPEMAMVREFEEETGLATPVSNWTHFLTMSGESTDGQPFEVFFFACYGETDDLKTVTDETVVLTEVAEVNPARNDMVENLPWLIGLAYDHLYDGRPRFTSVLYGGAK
jgi:8-oxo-dGTP diphosphatase